MSDLSIIIVTYNSAQDIGPCLDSIQATKGDLDVEIFVVDNASKDHTVEIVRTEHPWVRLLANDFNAGFPAGNNQAITQANGRYLMLLNPDTVVLPDALQKIVAFMDANADCGVCGPVMLDTEGRRFADLRPPSVCYHLICTCGLKRFLRKQLPPRAVKIVSGACLVLRRKLIDEVGLLDENLFWWEDVDYCLRVAASGYRVCAVPDASVIHLVGQSVKSNLHSMLPRQNVSRIRFLAKNHSAVGLRLILLIFLFRTMLRWLKWRGCGLFAPSEKAGHNIDAMRIVVPMMARALFLPRRSLAVLDVSPSLSERGSPDAKALRDL